MKYLGDPSSGSQAGTTASRNRFGQYYRTRATPVNPNTPAQQNARNRLAAQSQAWGALTANQRQAWEAYAANHPVVDSLGQSNILTGAQMFVSINTGLLNCGLATVTAPPATAPDAAPTLGAVTTTVAGLSIAFGANPVPAGEALLLESSPPMSPGRSYNADFRVVKVRAAAAANTLVKADQEVKWGGLVAGQKYFIRASRVRTDGARSAYTAYELTVT
jgi:hypothetical protein